MSILLGRLAKFEKALASKFPELLGRITKTMGNLVLTLLLINPARRLTRYAMKATHGRRLFKADPMFMNTQCV